MYRVFAVNSNFLISLSFQRRGGVLSFNILILVCLIQGYNARKVISEVYAAFVLQCTVIGW